MQKQSVIEQSCMISALSKCVVMVSMVRTATGGEVRCAGGDAGNEQLLKSHAKRQDVIGTQLNYPWWFAMGNGRAQLRSLTGIHCCHHV